MVETAYTDGPLNGSSVPHMLSCRASLTQGGEESWTDLFRANYLVGM